MVTHRQRVDHAANAPAKKLAARRGKDAWLKYFATEPTSTKLKVTSQARLPDGTLTDIILNADTAVLTIPESEYTPQQLVRVGTTYYRVSIYNIAKPFTVGKTFDGYLKPNLIGVVGEFLSDTYPSAVERKLNQVKGLPRPYYEYLTALVEFAADHTNDLKKQKVQSLFTTTGIALDQSFIQTINNDFLEVLGPLFLSSEPGFIINFPRDGNQGLYDFEIDRVHFSSKRAVGHTNTIKAKDILDHLVIDSPLALQYPDEVDLISLINATPAKDAPEKLNDWLTTRFEHYPVAPGLDYLLPPEQLRLERIKLETIVINWINKSGTFKFDPIVQHAISHVLFVRAHLNSDGTLSVPPIVTGDEITGIVLRSKGTLSEKIGFAI